MDLAAASTAASDVALATARAELATLEAARRKFWGECEGSREWSPMDDRIEAKLREVADLARRIEEAAWTRDVTVARRAEWNAWVRANATAKGVSTAAAAAQQKRQGWTMIDLRAAIARHGL